MREENHWVIIPPPVAADKRLPGGAKLVFGRVFALVNKKGFCWASNAYLAKDLALTKGTVSQYLSQLAHLGFLKIELIRGSDNQVKERRIFAYLSNQGSIPIEDPIQLGFEKSIERDTRKERVVKREGNGMQALREIVDNLRKTRYVNP